MSKNGQQGQQQSKKKEATTAPSQNASSASESSQSPASETIKQIESQIKQIDRQLGKFDAQLMRMDHGIAALQEISTQKSAQLLVQVTDGIFINATVDNTKDIILAVGIFAVIVWQIKATARNLGVRAMRWAIPASSLIVFSVSQYQTWLWSANMSTLLNVLAVLGGIVVLANGAPNWRRLAAAAMLGIVATHSFTNGIILWPIGLLTLLTVTSGQPKRMAIISAWVLVSVVIIWSYFWHYQMPIGNTPRSLVLEHPLRYAAYVLTFLGGIGAQYPKDNDFGVGIGELAFLFGLAALFGGCWTVWLLTRWKIASLNALLPYIGMSLYSICSALLAGFARLGLGTEQAASSRYCTIVVPLWTSLVVLLCLLAKGKQEPVISSSLEAP